MVENGLKPLVRFVAISPHKAKRVSHKTNPWLAVVAILVCPLWIAGCASLFKAGKDKPIEARQEGSGLIHPTIPDGAPAKEPETVSAVGTRDGKKDDRQESGTRVTVAATAGALSKAGPETKETAPVLPRATSQPSGEGSREENGPEAKSNPAKLPSTERPAAKKDEPADSSGKASEDADSPFKKHDHAEYIRLIRNKAIDMVNQDGKAAYARVCRDDTTDDWSLNIYHWHGRNYSFVTYAWDEVDQKWVESFVTDKRPVAGWKKHLDFSTAGKDCKVLKERKGVDGPPDRP